MPSPRLNLLRALSIALLAASLLFPEAAPAAPGPYTGPDQLTLYAIPAPRRMRWSSPRALAFRAITNQAAFWHRDSKRSIGHAFVRLQSSATGRDQMVGMTSRVYSEDRDLILEDGYGMGVLGADMMGRLETDEELRAGWEERARTGLIASLRFQVSPEAMARMEQFLEEFLAQGLDDHYGGANRPRYREGGGCSAFAMAFLELAGLVGPEHEAWRVFFNVPEALYGGPLTGNTVTLKQVVLDGGRWASEDEPHVKMMLWDPTLMFRWIEDTWRAETREPTGAWGLEKHHMAKGLVRDVRSVPIPDEPLWLEDPEGEPHPWGRQESVRREVSEDHPGDARTMLYPALQAVLRALGDVPFTD